MEVGDGLWTLSPASLTMDGDACVGSGGDMVLQGFTGAGLAADAVEKECAEDLAPYVAVDPNLAFVDVLKGTMTCGGYEMSTNSSIFLYVLNGKPIMQLPISTVIFDNCQLVAPPAGAEVAPVAAARAVAHEAHAPRRWRRGAWREGGAGRGPRGGATGGCCRVVWGTPRRRGGGPAPGGGSGRGWSGGRQPPTPPTPQLARRSD